MATRLEEISKITAKGQTTVPRSIRRALGVDYGGKIAFRVDQGGVTLRRAETDDGDPVIQSFLSFLERDLGQRPERIVALDSDFASRLASLTNHEDVDLDAPIEGEVAL